MDGNSKAVGTFLFKHIYEALPEVAAPNEAQCERPVVQLPGCGAPGGPEYLPGRGVALGRARRQVRPGRSNLRGRRRQPRPSRCLLFSALSAPSPAQALPSGRQRSPRAEAGPPGRGRVGFTINWSHFSSPVNVVQTVFVLYLTPKKIFNSSAFG